MTETTISASGRFLDRLANAALAIAAVALSGIVIVQGWQVVARYVFNNSPGWTEPAAMLLLSTAMSFGAASGVHHQRHFRFPLLVDALPPNWQRLCEVLCALTIAGIGFLLAYWGGLLFLDGAAIHMAGSALPQSAPYCPIALGGLLMSVFALARIANNPAAAAARND
ncbi:MAG: TRAP transporter small permease [Arenimonas sp.]|nr:TRAP transporter small permease [Arenimonas sp.]